MPSFDAPPSSDPGGEPQQYGSDRVSAEYDREQAARRDLDALLKELNEVSGQLTWLARHVRDALSAVPYTYVEGVSDVLKEALIRDEGSVEHYAENLRDSVHQLIGTLHALVDAGPGQPPDLAFSAYAQFSALESAVDNAPTYDESRLPFLVKESITKTWAWIKAALKRGWKRLWSLISHLTRVKEWSVGGTASTGVLGMAQAQISVTFG